jgi:hypothetical protein
MHARHAVILDENDPQTVVERERGGRSRRGRCVRRRGGENSKEGDTPEHARTLPQRSPQKPALPA